MRGREVVRPMLRAVGTREGRNERGRRRGQQLLRRLIGELRTARQTAGVSQEALAKGLGARSRRSAGWSVSNLAQCR